MGYVLKFRLPNLYTIIIVAKTKKGFLKKKERVKCFFIFMCMLSLKQVESDNNKKEPANQVVVVLSSFLIVWISDTVNMALLFFQFKLKMAVHTTLTKKKIYEVNNFDTFFRRVNLILMFLQEELASLKNPGKPFSNIQKTKNSKLSPRREPWSPY